MGATQPTVTGSANRALIGATIGFFIGAGSVSLFGPTAHIFLKAMHLSPQQVGLLVAMPMLTGSLLRIPFGASVDRNGGRLPFLVLLIASVIGIAGLYWMLLTLYPNHLTEKYYPMLLTFGALAGCGIATFSVGIGQVSYWYSKKKQGWALAVFGGLGDSSPGFVVLILPAVIMTVGLWGGYLFSLAIIIVGIIIYYLMGLNAPYYQFYKRNHDTARATEEAKKYGQELFPTGGTWHTLLLSAKHWRTWPLVILYFTNFGGFLALTAWLPIFWQTYFHVGAFHSVVLTAVFSLIAAFIRVYGGKLSDEMGGEKTAVISLIVLLVGSVIMTFSSLLWLTIIGEILVGAGMGVNNAAVFKLVPHYVPDAVGGTAGWVGGLGCLGGFAIPPILGDIVALVGINGYALGFGIYIILSILCLLLVWLLYRTRANLTAHLSR
ncbi:MFS transporter [Acidithiobacillus thiooxidans]|uniref:MFS transporter n=1 Tax=Acidithiobacillus thiooxidans ATCC 19377 TaxID=637390 RepID=A0A5P9XRU3_ACITH|nr:MFS transporter [Acidithiobacillus thiooxidans]QFX95876.1 MFS transporter [Acidithiobacillus thiooxidans ATCC 19377]